MAHQLTSKITHQSLYIVGGPKTRTMLKEEITFVCTVVLGGVEISLRLAFLT